MPVPVQAGLRHTALACDALVEQGLLVGLKVGDQVTVVIPADNEDATWAAVEAGL